MFVSQVEQEEKKIGYTKTNSCSSLWICTFLWQKYHMQGLNVFPTLWMNAPSLVLYLNSSLMFVVDQLLCPADKTLPFPVLLTTIPEGV